jgi:hypothetical protein
MIFWKWWTSFVFVGLTAIIIEYFVGGISYIWENDSSYITSVITFIFLFTSLRIGYYSYTFRSNNKSLKENELESSWFQADAVTSLGMIGTVIGFVMVLTSAFAEIDIECTSCMTTLVSDLTSGMGTALLTTLVGLIASVILKFQLIMLERDIDA